MQSPYDNNHHRHRHSDTDLVGISGGDGTSFSGPLSGQLNKRGGGGGPKKSARFTLPDDSAGNDYVEITLDVREDTVAVHSVKAAGGGDVDDPEIAMLAKGLEKKSSFGSSIARNASSRIKQVSHDIKRLASLTRRPQPMGRFDRTKSAAAQALKGLKFISRTDGGGA